EAWGTVHDIGDQSKRFSAMRRLIAMLAPEDRPAALAEAWREAEALADPDRRSHFLSRLVPYTERDRQPGLILDLIRASASIDEDFRGDVLITLANNVALDQDAFQQALKMARVMRDSQNLACTLACLLPHAPLDDRVALFQESMRTARRAEHKSGWFARFLLDAVLPN